MHCNESGYAFQFEICSGKKEAIEKNLGEHIVKRLTECAHGNNRHIFLVNFSHSMNSFVSQKQEIFISVTQLF